MPNAEQHAPPVPAAVKAAAARAAQLQNELINPPKPKEEGEPPVEGDEPPEEQVEGKEEEHEEEQPASPPEQPGEPKNWEHAFKSMQGRYNSDMGKMREANKKLVDQVSHLNQLIATMQKPEPAKPAEPPKPSLSAEELAEYGPEFVEIVSKIVADTTAPYISEITSLKKQLQGVGGQINAGARERMMSSLAAAVPNWEEINTSEEFLDWLRLPDAYSGDIRHNMLNAAFGRNDSTRVINFFKGFLAELAAMDPANEEPGEEAKPPKTPLKKFAAPGRAKSTAAPNAAPVEKPNFTTSQISKFYADKALGKWRGREKEAAKMEAEIFAAQMEGRIRN